MMLNVTEKALEFLTGVMEARGPGKVIRVLMAGFG